MTATTLTPKALTEIFSCSGGTNGTVVEVSGNIVNAPCPAFEFDAVTHAALGLRVRGPQRANMLNNSDSSSGWGSNSPNTPIPNAFLGHNGTRIVTASVAGDNPNRQCGVINAAGGSLCASVLVDVSTMTGQTSRSISMWLSDADGGQNARQGINADGTAGGLAKTGANVSNEAGGVVKISGSIYLVWVSATFAKVASASTLIRLYVNGGAPGDGVVLGCPQIEAGTRPSAYIPTDAAGTNRTRSIDALTASNVHQAPWFNMTEGTFLVDFRPWMLPTASQAGALLCIATPSSSSYLICSVGPTGNIVMQNPAFAMSTPSGGVVARQEYRVVFSYKAGAKVAVSLQGAAAVLSTANFAGFPSSAHDLRLGTYGGNPGAFDGHIQNLQYWPKAANATELPLITPTTEVIAG